jgi:hypothetical protein
MPGQGPRIKPGGTRLVCFSVRLTVRVSLAGIELERFEPRPAGAWGSVLRVICVTIEQSHNRVSDNRESFLKKGDDPTRAKVGTSSSVTALLPRPGQLTEPDATCAG